MIESSFDIYLAARGLSSCNLLNYPERDLLAETGPTNVFDILLRLLEQRSANEIQQLRAKPPVAENPSLRRRIIRMIKHHLLKRMSGYVIPRDLTVVQHDIYCQDFLCYVLRHRPELPLRYFPEQVIRRDRPMLLIAAYHRGPDIFEFPALLREIVPEYQFRFRHLDPRLPISEYVIAAF